MKKSKEILNKKIMSVVALVLVFVMCFSPIVNAGVSLYTEETHNDRGGDTTLVTKKSVLLVSTDDAQSAIITSGTYSEEVNGTNQTYNWHVEMSFPDSCENGRINQTPTFTYYSDDGRQYSGTVKNMSFVVQDAAGNIKTVANTSAIYYDSSQGFIFYYTGDITPGQTIMVQYTYTDSNGVEHTVTQPVGEIGDEISTRVEVITEDNPGWLSTIWNLIVDTFDEVARLVEEITVELLLPLGDGVLYVVTASVGEVVTIDRLVFNGVGKVNIDYWNGITPGSKDIKAVMSGVVVPWYKVFYKLAIIVYIITLIVVGIQVLLNSTAEKKAKYKDVLVSWVVGVMMLTMFPFVLKYVVQLNNVAVTAMYSYLFNGATMDENGYVPQLIDGSMTINEAMKTFGTEFFVDAMLEEDIIQDEKMTIESISDSMLQTRIQAQYQKKIALVGVYFILLGQMIVLLFMYYKRAFMLAFLITIFPLVAMTYVIDKVGDKKAQSFGIWFKEYIVNVVVQIFHAVVYVIIVGTGIQSYVKSQGATWLFMIISVLFLFQGEKILRNIFGIKSSANTMADLAATGAAMYGILKISGGGKGDKNTGSKQDNADVKGASERQAQRNSIGGNGSSVPQEPQTGGGAQGSDGESSSRNQGNYTGNDPAGVEPAGYNEGAAQDTVIQSAMARRLGRGIGSKVANFAGKALGTTAGITYGLSKGDTADGSMFKNALSDGVSGGMIGSTVAAPVTAVANKVEQKVHGEKLAKRIEQGEMDNALTLNAPPGAMMPPNVDPNEIVGKHGETMQEIYRKALAEMARTTATKGKARGEVAYWNYIEENMDNTGN